MTTESEPLSALRDPFTNWPQIIAAWFETPEGAAWLEAFLAKRAVQPPADELAKGRMEARYA